MISNFLVEINKNINCGNYNLNTLEMYFDYIKTFDNEKMVNYSYSYSTSEYNNDLNIYVEVIDSLIKIFEDNEEYEKCEILKDKKNESLNIINCNNF